MTIEDLEKFKQVLDTQGNSKEALDWLINVKAKEIQGRVLKDEQKKVERRLVISHNR